VSNLDLQEQEQIAELKAFWDKYGNLILTALTIVMALLASKNGWEWWQRKQSAEAVVIFEKLDNAAKEKNISVVKDSSGNLLENYKGTAYAPRGALIAAKVFFDAGDLRSAKAQLQWVVDNAREDEFKAAARIRIAGVLLDEKQYPDAIKALEFSAPKSFQPLVADRKGDIYLAQGNAAEAKKSYQSAVDALDDKNPWKAIIQIKLESLGQ
jgi:predicted negative regulator of RcsB-dependent stress response